MQMVVAGHTLTPLLFQVGEGHGGLDLVCLGQLENSEQKKEQGGVSAMRKFQSLDRHAKVVNDEVNK